MRARERRGALVELLAREGRVEVGAAAELLGTAEMTIRRDLEQLAARGVARRVRGGAISLLMRGEEPPFAVREVAAVEAKRRIAAAVAAMVSDGESVVLDGGTTALEVARALSSRRLTVMPISLHGAVALSGGASIRLIMAGGEVRPGELAMTGPLALASIAAMRFDTAVMGCCGLADGLVTAHDLADAAVKQAMRRAAARSLLIADGSKFARSAMAALWPAAQADVLVTDSSAPPEALEHLRRDGVDVVCV